MQYDIFAVYLLGMNNDNLLEMDLTDPSNVISRSLITLMTTISSLI